MRIRTAVISLVAVAVVLVAAVSAGFVFFSPRRGSAQPAKITSATDDYGKAPTYTLIDQHGRTFHSVSLAGKIRVVSYLFPYCTSYCPLIARSIVQLEPLLAKHGLANRVDFVAFNVDPTGAGPKQMAAFLAEFRANPDDPHWHYLTGSSQQIHDVVTGGFHIFYKKVSFTQEQAEEAQEKAAGTWTPQPEVPNAVADRAHADYDIVHNDTIEIVGPQGRIQDVIDDADTATPAQLLAAVEKVAR